MTYLGTKPNIKREIQMALRGGTEWAGPPPLRPNNPKSYQGNDPLFLSSSLREDSAFHYLCEFIKGITHVTSALENSMSYVV